MIATILDTMQTLEEEEALISTTSMSSLPEEIQVDIFIKLPVKSISMSRCVCKLWYNLLSTSKFIKYHHNYNNIQNKNINHKLISITSDSYSIYSPAYDSVSSSPLPSFNRTLKVDMVEILGSCDGLICLRIHSSVIGPVNGRYYRIYIWNPLTREYKEVLVKSHFQGTNHGFGYDRNMDTYKLVRIGVQFRETGSFDIQVYTLESDSWNITRQSKVPYYISFNGMYTYGLLFNGALHWLGYKTDRETKHGVIVSFDITAERFGDVPLPPAAEHSLAFSSNSGRYCQKSVAVLGDYLCLFNVEYAYDSVADIWMMQKYGVQGSWTKQFSIIHAHAGIVYVPSFHRYLRLLCALENGELLISSGFTYDPKKKIFRDLNVRRSQMIIGISQSYVESLVSTNSGTYVGKASK